MLNLGLKEGGEDTRLRTLAYADDLTLPSTSAPQANMMLSRIQAVLDVISFKIHQDKRTAIFLKKKLKIVRTPILSYNFEKFS